MDEIPADERLEVVRRQAARWADELVDLGPHNSLLFYKESNRSPRLDLTDANRLAVDRLLARTKIRLSDLITDAELHKNACTRARSLRRRMVQLDEEQGLEPARLARGLLSVAPPPTKGTTPLKPLHAPLLLQPLELHARTGAEADFVIELGEEPEVNPILIYVLHHHYGMDIDVDQFGEKLNSILEEYTQPDEQLGAVANEIIEACARSNLSAMLDEHMLIGLFSYEKLPMVEDLRRSATLLAEHDIIAAAAGYMPIREELSIREQSLPALDLDRIAPSDEFLVQDADSYQQQAINAALAGRDLVIEGPPGTGKSQTIANIIAGMAARGKRVLFVAEKRAAIDAVMNRLVPVGLEELILDFHHKNLTRRRIAEQLDESLKRYAQELPANVGDLNQRLPRLRRETIEHCNALHLCRDPWGVSAYQLQSELLALPPECESTLRVHGTQLRVLDASIYPHVGSELRDFIGMGGLGIRRGESPWARSQVRNIQEVQDILIRLDVLAQGSLRATQAELEDLVARAAIYRPNDLRGWQEVLRLLSAVTEAMDSFGEDVFANSLDDLHFATGDRDWRRQQERSMTLLARRRLVRVARKMYRRGRLNPSRLHQELSVVLGIREHWHRLSVSGSLPVSINGLEAAIDHYRHVRDELAAVAACAQAVDLEQQSEDEIRKRLDHLASERDTLFQMPHVNELTVRLESMGLGQLLDELARRDASALEGRNVLRWAWLTSLWDQFRLDDSHLRNFVGDQQTSIVDDYRTADAEHVRLAAQRVRRCVADNLRKVRDAHPRQDVLVRDYVRPGRRRHMAPRQLVEKAPDVVLAIRPCWAMSPLLASRVLPNRRLFDLVIFDEASQVPPHDAVASIMRGRQLVVAGDSRQLPPNPFFQRHLFDTDELADEEDEDFGDLKVHDSILDLVEAVLPRVVTLGWHYRSEDERLIAFSNVEIYNRHLITFPGTREESPISLQLVDGIAEPGQNGSASEEVDRVVRLVIDHASSRPDESLGVITMGSRHERRIDRQLHAARKARPDLDAFFSDDQGPNRRFFTKSLESVQGDERDAIILSIGYARSTPGGPVKMTWGPLTQEGGERRLNVAVTRARRRLTVVSSFSHLDLDPGATATAKYKGPELLRLFLEFAARGGNLERVSGRATGYELNGFERSVLQAIEEAGIPVEPQWGVSEFRIDFALAHPQRRGQMVLAVETDGEQYHSSPCARDRDRLRQQILERHGWQFHRLWSTDWFKDPDGELQRIKARWLEAVAQIDEGPQEHNFSSSDVPSASLCVQPKRGARPPIPKKGDIRKYNDDELIRLCRWLLSDQLPLSRDQRIDQAMPEFGLKNRGRVIVERLNWAFDQAERIIDRGAN